MMRTGRWPLWAKFSLGFATVGVVGAAAMWWRYGEPRGADQWTTTGTLLYDYLTLGLLIAAVYAGYKVNEQIQNERQKSADDRRSVALQLQTDRRHHRIQMEEMKRSREGSLMPVIAMTIHRRPSGVVIGIVNVGPGPAIGLFVDVWFVFFPGADPQDQSFVLDVAQPAVTERARSTPTPDYFAYFPVLPSGGSVSKLLSVPDPGSAGLEMTLMQTRHNDVFRNELGGVDGEMVGVVSRRQPRTGPPLSGTGTARS